MRKVSCLLSMEGTFFVVLFQQSLQYRNAKIGCALVCVRVFACACLRVRASAYVSERVDVSVCVHVCVCACARVY